MQNILARLADSVASACTLEELTRPLLEMLEAITGLESTYLTAIDSERGVQHIVYARNSRLMQIPEGLTVPWDDTLCKRALEEGRTHTDDVAACWGDSEAARALGIKTYVSTPVSDGSGLYGTLCAASSTQVPLARDAEKVLGMFARLIGQHIERERLIAELRAANDELSSAALIDQVTGLPNRRALFREGARMLARAHRDGSTILVAFIDLDGFKAINDSCGHDAGDELLRAVGERLQSRVRGSDLVARFGGDEFVVVAPSPADSVERSRKALGGSLAACIRGTYDIAGRTLQYQGASVGLAVGQADSGDIESLVRHADAAMYADKRQRKLEGVAR